MEEYFYTCPYCYSNVSLLVDLSVKNQQLIEDCERCCNPIQFDITTNGKKVVRVELGEVN